MCIFSYAYMTFLPLWHWPFVMTLTYERDALYSEDVQLHQKWSFCVKALKSKKSTNRTYRHTDTHLTELIITTTFQCWKWKKVPVWNLDSFLSRLLFSFSSFLFPPFLFSSRSFSYFVPPVMWSTMSSWPGSTVSCPSRSEQRPADKRFLVRILSWRSLQKFSDNQICIMTGIGRATNSCGISQKRSDGMSSSRSAQVNDRPSTTRTKRSWASHTWAPSA